MTGVSTIMGNLENFTRTEINNMIDEYVVGRNAERNRAILKRRFIDGICYEPLAEEFDLSVRQVKVIVSKYARKLPLELS
jgi:hypothetical protein